MSAHQRAHENRLEDKDLSELDALEDEEDGDFLASYRQKRMAEINALQKTSLHGSVYPLQKADYARDVTDASKSHFVLVLLTSSSATYSSNATESALLSTRLWPQLAQKYPDVKFCSIRADMCIEGYPERNTPTILCYRDGDIRRQIVTLRELDGMATRLEDLEHLLVAVGALQEGDLRVRRRNEDEEVDDDGRIGGGGGRLKNGGGTRKKALGVGADDSDDDWD